VDGIRVTALQDDQRQQQQNVMNGCAEWLTGCGSVNSA